MTCLLHPNGKRKGPTGLNGRSGDSRCWAGGFAILFERFGEFAHVHNSPVPNNYSSLHLSCKCSGAGGDEGGRPPLSKQRDEGSSGGPSGCQGSRKYSILLWHAHLDAKTKPAHSPYDLLLAAHMGSMHGRKKRGWRGGKGRNKRGKVIWKVKESEKDKGKEMMQHWWYSLTPYLPPHVLYQIHGSHHKVENWPSATTYLAAYCVTSSTKSWTPPHTHTSSHPSHKCDLIVHTQRSKPKQSRRYHSFIYL